MQQDIITAVNAHGTTTIITHINMCLMLIREFSLTDMVMYISNNMGYLTADQQVYFSNTIQDMHRNNYHSVN